GAPLPLLAEHPETLFAVGRLLGVEPTPIAFPSGDSPAGSVGTAALLSEHPATLHAVSRLL
ncbi:MAG: hypothetical protein ACRC7O_09185, partial [Fimbriiglobus sp.]